MRTTRLTTLWIGIALLVALVSGAGLSRQDARAGGPPATSPLLRTLPITVATIVAVDAVTDHVFAVAIPGGLTTVYMLDGRSGAILRRTPLAGQFASNLAIDGATGRVFVVTPRPARVFVLNARTGALLHILRLIGIPAALAVDEQVGHVFVAEGNTDRVDVLDARTGILLHTVRVGAHPAALTVSRPTDRLFVVNLGDGSVSVLNARDGTALRTVHVGDKPLFADVDPGVDRVVVSGEYGALSILDARAGRVVHSVPLDAISAQLAVDRQTHRIFQDSFPDSGGALSVYDARTGSLLRTTPLGGDPLTTPVLNAVTGHMLVLLGSSQAQPGAVVALDGLTGAVRASVPVKMAFGSDTNIDIQIAVDAHTRRVFVSTINAIIVLDATRL